MQSGVRHFSLKFIDIMIGVVLGLGFQWWPALTEPWQYIAFVFVYIDIIDYWIDYGPALRKFPPKREFDIILDVANMFGLFLYIYTTQLSIGYFLASFIVFKLIDLFWLIRVHAEYHPRGIKGLFVSTWITTNLLEAVAVAGLIAAVIHFALLPGTALIIFIIINVGLRVLASSRYRQLYFV